MNLPIRWKMTLSAVLAVVLSFIVAGWFALRSIERLELARLTDTLAARTGLAALAIQPHLPAGAPSLRNPPSELTPLIRTLSQEASARVTVIAADGRVLADSETDEASLSRLDNHATRPEVAQAMLHGHGTEIRVSQTTGKRMLYFALAVPSPASLLAIVRLSIPMVELETRIHAMQRILGLAFSVALSIAVAVSVLLARGLTRPLSDMAAVARKLAAGQLQRRVGATSRDEFGVLGDTLNQMAERLESTVQEVTEDRAQLLAVLTSMVEGVMVLDCRGKILQANPALERMFRIQGMEIRGRLFGEVIRHAEFNELTREVLEKRRPHSGEITIAPSGRTLRVEASMAGCERENEACAVFVFHDVTRLRQLEKIRKDFVANVSHELRTPLTSIKGYVEALLDGAKDRPDEAARFLEIILKQSDRLNLILDDLLQLSQIESGQVSFKRDAVNVHAVGERTLALIKPLSDKKGHHLTIDLPETLPPILGDEERLVQVLTNLLDNAVKYTQEHGTIRVEGRPVHGPGGVPDMLEISVVDNGIGIPEQDRPRVFERFYRVDKARSRELGGTGLGLAIVKHIVEGHGGQIWVEGNQPAGSRFVMRFPTAAATDARRQNKAERPR